MRKRLTDHLMENVVQFSMNKDSLKKIVSVINAEGPPVPIPNTEVKLCSGENTLRETVREDSSMLTSVEGTDKTVPEIEKPSVRPTLKSNHIGS